MWEAHGRSLFWCVVLGASIGAALGGYIGADLGSDVRPPLYPLWVIGAGVGSLLGLLLCFRPVKDGLNRPLTRWMCHPLPSERQGDPGER